MRYLERYLNYFFYLCYILKTNNTSLLNIINIMAKKVDFKYAPMFQVGKDDTEYRLISKEGISTGEFEGKTILKVSKESSKLANKEHTLVNYCSRRK